MVITLTLAFIHESFDSITERKIQFQDVPKKFDATYISMSETDLQHTFYNKYRRKVYKRYLCSLPIESKIQLVKLVYARKT